MQEGKWLCQDALHIVEERRKAKSKVERERYAQLNAEFQRISRREKKVFLNEQGKKVEESNRMGKTRDLFKKTGTIKGTFSAKIQKKTIEWERFEISSRK